MKPITLLLILPFPNTVSTTDIIYLDGFEAPNIKIQWIENIFNTLEGNTYPQSKVIS